MSDSSIIQAEVIFRPAVGGREQRELANGVATQVQIHEVG